ncbi:MAG: class I SAM-dependent methyltransferase [Candidatus Bathyarchaeota archaeon]|nr:class I SAM-dependent methyltransferase [Candidatus Termiticorpusculum sp.]
MLSSWRKKRLVAKCYDVTAESYDVQYAQEQIAKYVAAERVLNQSFCDVVLDVGCGSGLFFSYVAGRAGFVVGVDISRKLLFKAKERAKFFDSVCVVQADADYLPFRDVVFDVIFAFTMLQNMPVPKKTLVEFKRKLGVDGKLVVTGLRKVFGLDVFLDLFVGSGLCLFGFIDDSSLNCYVAIVTG